ncbi:hypothetical protein FHP25_35860 [Vineibacter terrae]|uniref:Phage tail protein n=1 Tax=Vineibacter terrae TaxID=2586908 RepID=A0A5C8P961_9HYPH|nr:hypothetical protein [Vineibacter terrae]TXL70100.1 hypothetical protein FHP25_35860 [Vineibacter terrae]
MRDLTAALAAGIQAGVVRPVMLFEGEFAGGTTRVWTGIGDLAWNGQTWLGIGYLGGISDIEETDELRAAGVTVSMSGIPQSLISLALGDVRQNKPGRLYFALMDGDTSNLVADPYLAFEGRLDVVEIDEGAETATISIKYENRLIDLERPRERRYTHEDQQLDYPGDMGFEFVPALQDAQISWGSAGGGGSGGLSKK